MQRGCVALATNSCELNEVHGLVIHEMKYKNTSKILKVFTRQLGKISILAQGAMRPGSDKAGVSNLYGLNNYCLARGKSFYYINSAEQIQSFHTLGKDLKSMVVAGFIAELLDRTMVEEGANEEVFSLVVECFDNIAGGLGDPGIPLIAFVYKFISFMGYRPMFTGCIHCGGTTASDYRLSAVEGGVICGHCEPLGTAGWSLNREEFRLLNTLLYRPIRETSKIKIEGTGIDRRKVLRLTLYYLTQTLELKEMNSIQWMEKVQLL